MTGKRFKEIYPDIIRSNYCFTDNGEPISDKKVCDLLNELHEEREYWKQQAERRFERIRELEEMIEWVNDL